MSAGAAGRSGAIDAVRVLGISAVIAGHTLGVPLVRPLFYSWHVPLFFFLAGYFWAEDRSLREEAVRRTRTLAVPYAVWFVLIALVFVPADSSLEDLTPQRLFAPFLNGQTSAMPYTTFWFVSALFATVLLMRLLWLLPRGTAWTVGVLGCVAGALYGPALAQTPLAIGSALPCLIFALIGHAARRLRERVSRPLLLGLALLAASAALIATGVSAPVDIKQGDFGTPGLSVVVAAAVSFALILIAQTAFAALPPVVHRIATLAACSGFAVVLMHPLVFWLLETFLPGSPGWAVFAVTFTVAWLVGLVALRTPAARLLTGSAPLRFRGVFRPAWG